MIQAWSDGGVALFQFVSSLVAVAAFGLLLYRLITSLDELSYLATLLTATLAAGLLIGAAVTIELGLMNGAVVYSSIPLFMFRVFALGLGVTWGYWLRHSRSLHPVLKPRSTGSSTGVESTVSCGRPVHNLVRPGEK